MVRALRDRLQGELDKLDRLGLWDAALSLDAAIESLSASLGEPTDHRYEALLKRCYMN